MLRGLIEALQIHQRARQHAARFEILGICRDRFFKHGQCELRLIEREPRRAKRDQRGQRPRLDFENRFEMRDGLTVPASHVLGQSQIKQEARISRHRLNQSLIDRDRFLEAARGHKFFGALRLERRAIRLPGAKR